MNKSINPINSRSLIILMSIIFASGCATNPDSLKVPSEITCVDLKESLSFTGSYGPLNVAWTTRLESGPYWSEKVDENGTFYRAPQGGVSITGNNGAGTPGYPTTSDGGFYIPNNPNEPVTIYRYFSTAAVPAQASQNDAECSTIGFVKDPVMSKVSLVSFAAGGAVGGAAGGIVGKSLSQNSNMSYGQSAGVGAAGGLIAGVIVASMINADVGKITPGLAIQDSQFMDKLRKLSATKSSVKEIQLSTGSDQSVAEYPSK